MKNNHLKHKRFPHVLIFVILFAVVFSLAVMLLWNWLMPVIFKLPSINYWQALGILVLSKILFTIPGRNHSHFPKERREFWKKIIEEKMQEQKPNE